MNKPKAFFVITQFNYDLSLIMNYVDDNYVIYDKSNTLDSNDCHIVKVPNVGYNIHDELHFIINHYDNLPELIVFVKGNFWKHCKVETFNKIIMNEYFTPIEDYSDYPEYFAYKKDVDGGYMEINNSWFLLPNNFYMTHEYIDTYNQFLDETFENPVYPEFVRFSPGGQYIVPRKNILYYTVDFYKRLIELVNYSQLPAEAHLLERAMYTIFTNKFKEKRD
jgi:hypothetical protein